MKTHTQNYKNQLKSLGKELDAIITIGNTELTSEQINSVNLHYEGNILKSVMKQLDLVLTEPLEKGTELNYKFGLDVNGTNEYMDYGQFIVKEVEKQEDTNTYKITCYDKMLYSMVDYEDMNLTYPITIKNYLQAICTKLGLTLKDDNFANQDNEIENELYLDSEGNSLGYTFRDVLDEIAQATGSTICINDNDELEVRYIDDAINETQDVEGTNLNLTDTEEARLRNISLKGDTSQDGTPTPTTPINIDIVSGLQEVEITNGTTTNTYDINLGKNIFNKTGEVVNGTYSNDLYTSNTINSYQVMNIKGSSITYIKNKKYYISMDLRKTTDTGGVNAINVGTTTGVVNHFPTISNEFQKFYIEFTPTSDYTSTGISIQCGSTSVIFEVKNVMVSTSSDIEYEPYFTPIELCKIGTYQDKIFKGKGVNYIDVNNLSAYNSGWVYYIDNPFKESGTYTYSFANTSYFGNTSHYFSLKFGDDYTAKSSTQLLAIACSTSNYSFNITNEMVSKKYLLIYPNASGLLQYIKDSLFMVQKGNIKTDYEPYGAKDKWLLHKEIGKVVLNGSESDWFSESGGAPYCYPVLALKNNNVSMVMSNYFEGAYWNANWNTYTYMVSLNNATSSRTHLKFRYTGMSSLNDFKTWLSTHNTIVYYVLANPTTEEITNSELVSQLNALDKAHTLDGTTNITSSFPLSLTYVSEIETIDEELIKNTRASFDNVYSPINSLVLSRSADSDNIYIQDEDSIEENGLHELKIANNQILNGNNRDEYINEIFEKVNGLTYSYNDFESIGITYLELCDRYKVKVRDNTYKCVMFNDEIEVNNGLNEIIYTDEAEESKTDYTKADKTDRRINQTTLIVDKQQGIIESLVEKVVDISNTINGTGSITLENAHSGNLHYLSIKGNISQLFPNDSVKPSNNLKPIGPTLLIDDVEYTLDIDRLRYVNNTLCDEFVYKDGKCYIIRKLNSSNQALANEVIEERDDIVLEINSNSTISLKNFASAIFKCEYLLENVYTDNFASQVDVKSSFTQTENMIAEKVEAVADENGNVTSGSIMLAINKDESQAVINADKIKLEGYTTINDGFSVDLEGNMVAKSGDIGGWKLNMDGLTNDKQFIHNNGYSNIYTYADMVTIRNYLLGNISLTETDIEHYDLNKDGVVDIVDLAIMRKMILGEDTEGGE